MAGLTGLFGLGSEAKKKNTVASLHYQTSQKGGVIPLVYGCNRIAGNLLDYQNFNAKGGNSKGGKGGVVGGGGKGGSSSNPKYQVDFIMGLCQGPVFNLGEVWFNKTITTLFGGLTAGTVATMGYGGGNDGQAADSNWYPPNQLGYSGTTWFSVEKFQLAQSPALPNINVEVYGLEYGTAPNGCDANPANIVIDLLTNPRYGAQFPDANLDISGSLADYGNYCDAVGLMLAPVYDSQQSASQMLAEIAAITNSAIVWSGGLLKIIPYGDQPRFATYTPASFTGELNLGDQISVTLSGAFPGSPVTVSHFLSANDVVSYAAAGASLAMLITGDGTTEEPGNGTLAAAGIFASVTLNGLVVISTGVPPVTITATSSGSESLVIGSPSATYSWSPDTTPIYRLGDDDFIVQESSVGTYLGVTAGGSALRQGAGPITGGFSDDPVHITRSAPADALNMVQLETTDRGTSYNTSIVEAFDQGAIDLYGVRRDTSVQARAIVDPYYVATTVAQLVLQRQIAYRNTYSFKLGWKYILLEPMDLVQITDERLGAEALTVRITGIQEDDEGTLSVSAEDWFGSPDPVLYPPIKPLPTFGGVARLGLGAATASPYAKQSGSSTASTPNYGAAAPAVNPPFIFEPTAQLLAAEGRTSPYIVIGLSGGPGGSFNPNWGGANVYISLDRSSFARFGEQAGSSVMGYTTADCSAAGTSLAVDLAESDGVLTSVSAQLATNAVSLCAIRTPAGVLELLSYTTASLTGANQYTLTGLYRGLYGTVAIDLPPGSQFLALGAGSFFMRYCRHKLSGKRSISSFKASILSAAGWSHSRLQSTNTHRRDHRSFPAPSRSRSASISVHRPRSPRARRGAIISWHSSSSPTSWSTTLTYRLNTRQRAGAATPPRPSRREAISASTAERTSARVLAPPPTATIRQKQGRRMIKVVGLLLMAAAWCAASPAHAALQSNSYPSTGAVLSCQGRPWIDVICYGADPKDSTDSTIPIQTAINDAVTNNVPVHFPAGTYKVNSQITIDYAGTSGTGFRLISGGATLDGNSIASGPVLQVQCSGGTGSSPATCFYFHQEGTLFVQGTSNEVNITTLSSSAATGATILSVASTANLYVGQTVLIALTAGGSYASAITAIGSGTITLATGLSGPASNSAIVGRPSYVFAMGKIDFSDQHNSFSIQHLVVKNNGTAAGAGACQFNAAYDAQVYAVCDSAGGGAGIALEEMQFSKIAGAGSAAGTGGQAIVLENGYNFSNTFYALDLEVAPICISITDNHHGANTFISPYMNCTTAVNATASDSNVLINPQYAGNVINYGPQSIGISVIGMGSRAKWVFPTTATYTAAAIDEGLSISSYNTPGAAMTVTTPVISTVNAGWSMAVATDNGKGMTLNGNGASLLVGNKSVASITLGPGNYEYVRVESDGNNWRVTNITRNTMLLGGFQAPPWPSNWLYPSTSGYSATLGDNGNVLSSYNTSAGLTVTLPATSTIPNGWAMGFATDNDKPISVNVTDGHIVYPGSGAANTTIQLANSSQGAYEYLVLQYDSTGSGSNFRVIDATPATWQAIGTIGSAGFSHWTFPATSAYQAGLADNGNVLSSYNSPLANFTLTLPASATLTMGWTIGLASDGNRTTALQVSAGDAARILFPGSGATTTSLTLAPNNYEFAGLRYDGSNFRVTTITPASATAIGVLGADFSLNRFNFPSAGTYAAQITDGGNTLSSYNTSAGLTVTLPAVSALYPGWTMGFMTDNGKSMTINTTGPAVILVPANGGGQTASLKLGTGNYEFVQLRNDGSNWRITSTTPSTANDLGMITLPTSCALPGSGVLYNSSGVVRVC